MTAPNPTPKAAIAPPSSTTSPPFAGSKPMAVQNQDQRKTPPPTPWPLKCPRCDSSNTKFCYYNNYSLSQPRHFCKACKRYWTRGGTLRNVPVGGGCRKNKRFNKKHRSEGAETPSTSVATKNPNPNNPLINLPTRTSYDDDNIIGGLVIPSNDQLPSPLIALHKTPADFSSNGYPTFKFGSQDVASLLQQDCLNVNSALKDVKVEGIESINAMGNNISNDVDLWRANYLFDQALNSVASDTSYMYWNPPIGGTCWPDATANSSVVPLI